MKNEYLSPEIILTKVSRDIITYSEEEEWDGPIIKAGLDEDDQNGGV